MVSKIYKGMKLVKVSSVPGFRKFMYGQTTPVIEEDDSPYDWAYYHDYENFLANGKLFWD